MRIKIKKTPEYAEGGIHIKKSHEGRFTRYKERTGKTTEEALHSDDPHVRKMAQFAVNASKWHHAYGGFVYGEGGDVDKKNARKVDKAPEGYQSAGEEGGRKYYMKDSAVEMQLAAKSKIQGGAQYEQFLQGKLASGVSPDELMNKGYISKEEVNAYAKYYKPLRDIVYTEGAVVPQDAPAASGMAQMMYDGSQHAVGLYSFANRKTDTQSQAGNKNTGYENVVYEPVDKMGKKTGVKYMIPSAAWNNLTTNRRMPDSSKIAQYLVNNSTASSFAKGGMYDDGGPNDEPYPTAFKPFKYKSKNYAAPEGVTPQWFYSNPWVREQLKLDQTFPKAWTDSVWGPEHDDVYQRGLKEGKIGVPIGKNPVGGDDPSLAGPPRDISTTPTYTTGASQPAATNTQPQGPHQATETSEPFDERFSDMDRASIFNSLYPIKKYAPERVQVRYTPTKWYDQDLTAQRQMIKGQLSSGRRAAASFAGPQSVTSSIADSMNGQGLDALNSSFMTEFETNRAGRMGTEAATNQGFDNAYNTNRGYASEFTDKMNDLDQNMDDAKAFKRQQFLMALQNAVKNRDTRKLLGHLAPNYPIGRNFDVGFAANPNIFNAMISKGSGVADRPISWDEYKQLPEYKSTVAQFGAEGEKMAWSKWSAMTRSYPRTERDWDLSGTRDSQSRGLTGD